MLHFSGRILLKMFLSEYLQNKILKSLCLWYTYDACQVLCRENVNFIYTEISVMKSTDTVYY